MAGRLDTMYISSTDVKITPFLVSLLYNDIPLQVPL